MNQEIDLRTTFDSDALLYDAIRPNYPEELFDRLVQECRLADKSQLLEIGPGTGQATLPLARRGHSITAVELGANLADVARSKLKSFQKVRVITGSFEDAVLPAKTFDLVYAATAFHWIAPQERFRKPHELLKSAGHLALIRSEHVSGDDGDLFFLATQQLYDKYFPNEDHTGFRLPRIEDLRAPDVDDRLFKLMYHHGFSLVIPYRAAEYVRLLRTYSPTIAMPVEAREHFLSGISDLIDNQFGGSVNKRYAMTLAVAEKQG